MFRKYPPYETSPAATVYLAEGSTAWGFDTYITIQNPNPVQVHADITYMTSGGPKWGGRLPLPAESQTTVRPSDVVGAADFSTRTTPAKSPVIQTSRKGLAAPIRSSFYPRNGWYVFFPGKRS